MAGQTITNLGLGGVDLNGQSGSTSGSDSNDPLFLDWNGRNYVYLPGLGSNNMSTPAVAALNITGDIDVRAYLRLEDWTPGTICYPFLYWTSITGGYILYINTSGKLGFQWATGAANIGQESTVAPTLTDGSAYWIRATLDVNNGAGGYDLKFYTSTDGISWTQVGATVTGGATTVIGTQSAGAQICTNVAGDVYRIVVMNGIAGTTVLDVDTSYLTTGAAATFIAATGQTITIARAGSGRQSCAVVSPVWLFGTDDYFEVADNALLDFTSSESLTLFAVQRQWAFATNDAIIAKKANTTAATQGWLLGSGSSTAAQSQGQIGDGSAGVTAVSASRASGVLSTLAVVRNVTADTLTSYMNGTAGTPVSDTTTGYLANSEVVRVGRLSGAGTEYSDMELVAIAVFRRALTAAEVSSLHTYYTARLS